MAATGSAALLLASNTIGASCLALPQVCQGPGLGPSMTLFLGAYGLNLLSGLAIARVAMDAHHHNHKVSLTQSHCRTHTTTPQEAASFRSLAAHQLGPNVGHAVSILSLLVNTCALVFDLSRMDEIVDMLHPLAPMTALPSSGMLLWTGLLVTAVVTQTNQRLSTLASLNMMVLMLSFGSFLLPALQQSWATGGVILPLDPGRVVTDGSQVTAMAQAAPVILMALVYQNIVPSIVKLLHYKETQVNTALTLGSAIPLGLYMAWCLVGSGGTMDAEPGSPVTLMRTVFFIVTVMGSSLGSIMSLSEELQPYVAEATSADADAATTTTPSDRYSPSSVLLAVSLPLAANLILGPDMDFTPALAVAGSVGSPLLYGVIPAMMLYAQQQSKSPWKRREPWGRPGMLVQGIPLVGILSTMVLFGQEAV